jgi:predicted transcriptional regulator
MAKREFGELEMAILQVLKPDQRVTVKEVCQLLGNKDKYNTIMTVMVRLAQKKTIERERIGASYQYWLKNSLSSFVRKKLMGIKPVEMVCYLCDAPEAVSDEDLKQMESFLEK